MRSGWYEKNQEPYNIGLDIGTSSIGWSIMNDNFDLMRVKGKKASGYDCITKDSLLLKEECIGLPDVDMDEENGV